MFKIFGHRGAVDVCPENSMSGFRKAADLGADGIELDIHKTSDGEIVVFHDFELDRMTYSKGYIGDYTLSDLEKISIGKKFSEDYKYEKIPTLKEVLEFLKTNDMEVAIEFKAGSDIYDNIEEETIKLVDDYGLLDRALFSSFDHKAMKKLNNIDKNIYTAAIYMGMFLHDDIIDYAVKNNFTAISPLFKHLTSDLLKKAKDNNIDINVYTIYNMEEYDYVNGLPINAIMANNLTEIFKKPGAKPVVENSNISI